MKLIPTSLSCLIIIITLSACSTKAIEYKINEKEGIIERIQISTDYLNTKDMKLLGKKLQKDYADREVISISIHTTKESTVLSSHPQGASKEELERMREHQVGHYYKNTEKGEHYLEYYLQGIEKGESVRIEF